MSLFLNVFVVCALVCPAVESQSLSVLHIYFIFECTSADIELLIAVLHAMPCSFRLCGCALRKSQVVTTISIRVERIFFFLSLRVKYIDYIKRNILGTKLNIQRRPTFKVNFRAKIFIS